MVDDRRERRREEILRAALRLIGRGGREAITHRAVAEEAGVPLGSTTYYFDSRDDLLRQALEQVAADQIESYRAWGEELAEVESPAELAEKLVAGLVRALEDRSALIAEYELWLEAGRRPELQETARDWCGAEQAALARALERLGSDEAATDAKLLVAALDGLGEQVLATEDPVVAARELTPEVRRLIERLVDRG